MIKLAIVEDQAMLRESLACAIGAQSDIDVVASLGDAALALEAVETSGATCALLDVCTENDSSGIVAARKDRGAARPDGCHHHDGMPETCRSSSRRATPGTACVQKTWEPLRA